MPITKPIAREIGQRILDLSRDAIKKEFGLDLTRLGGSFTDTELTMKFMVAVPISKIDAPKNIDDAMVKAGLAPRGTVVTINGEEYTILKTRRTKYSIQDKNGKTWVANFTSCRLKGAGADTSTPKKDDTVRKGDGRFDGLPKKAVDEFEALECALSPENLACDGEIPRSEINKRYRMYMKEWKALENRYGVTIEPYV